MRKVCWFVYVPKCELHAAFISREQDIKDDPKMIVVQDGLTQKAANAEAMKIRRGQRVVAA